jgi:hypothetical protein
VPALIKNKSENCSGQIMLGFYAKRKAISDKANSSLFNKK